MYVCMYVCMHVCACVCMCVCVCVHLIINILVSNQSNPPIHPSSMNPSPDNALRVGHDKARRSDRHGHANGRGQAYTDTHGDADGCAHADAPQRSPMWPRPALRQGF